MKNAEIVRFMAFLNLNKPHHDPSIWHLTILLPSDRDAATLRYHPASRAQWPEQSRELTPLRRRPFGLRILCYVCAWGKPDIAELELRISYSKQLFIGKRYRID